VGILFSLQSKKNYQDISKYSAKTRAFLFVRKRVDGERRREFYRFLTPMKNY
jgi:hypothetical protein